MNDWTIGGIDGEGEGDAPDPAPSYLSKGFAPKVWEESFHLRFTQLLLDTMDGMHAILKDEGFDFEAADSIIRGALRQTLIDADVIDEDEPLTEEQVEMIALIRDEG